MLKLNISPEKILPLLKNTLLPALLFGAAVIGFYAANPLAENGLLTLHSLFCRRCKAFALQKIFEVFYL